MKYLWNRPWKIWGACPRAKFLRVHTVEDNPTKKKKTYWKLTANRCQTRHENERIAGYLGNCTYKFPSKRGIFRSQHSRIRQIFYFVIPHPSPSSRVASYFVNCIDAFSLYSLAEGERETEDFACSAYRTASFRVLHIPQTNVSLLRFSVTDGEPMVFLSMKFFRSLGWFISPSIGCL